MNRDDIIRTAREAFHDPDAVDAWQNGFWVITQEELERFAELVAAAEREACAKMFDGDVWAYDYREIAAAIRARGSNDPR
jgi:hypothetical protein